MQRRTTRQRHDRQTASCRAIIGITEEVVANAKTALDTTTNLCAKTFGCPEDRRPSPKIVHYCGLIGPNMAIVKFLDISHVQLLRRGDEPST
jgi:hypothetical protein